MPTPKLPPPKIVTNSVPLAQLAAPLRKLNAFSADPNAAVVLELLFNDMNCTGDTVGAVSSLAPKNDNPGISVLPIPENNEPPLVPE